MSIARSGWYSMLTRWGGGQDKTQKHTGGPGQGNIKKCASSQVHRFSSNRLTLLVVRVLWASSNLQLQPICKLAKSSTTSSRFIFYLQPTSKQHIKSEHTSCTFFYKSNPPRPDTWSAWSYSLYMELMEGQFIQITYIVNEQLLDKERH